MDDKNLMEDVLVNLKGVSDLYMHGTIEAATLVVHSTFHKLLDETLELQFQVYNRMKEKGWYQVTDVEQQKIDTTKQSIES